MVEYKQLPFQERAQNRLHADYREIGNITCDFAAVSETFKLTLQYNTASGTNYADIAEAEAAKGEWVVLENTAFTIPEGSWGCSITLRPKAGPTASISTKRSEPLMATASGYASAAENALDDATETE